MLSCINKHKVATPIGTSPDNSQLEILFFNISDKIPCDYESDSSRRLQIGEDDDILSNITLHFEVWHERHTIIKTN